MELHLSRKSGFTEESYRVFHSFNDDALGHALDRIHQKGTLKLFTEVSLKAANIFNLDTSHCSFDTTSVNVWGNFADSLPNQKAPKVTYGYSKDKRPDLKQLMVSMLCVEGNIPISGKMQNGNSCDEKPNNEELQRISRLLEPLGARKKQCDGRRGQTWLWRLAAKFLFLGHCCGTPQPQSDMAIRQSGPYGPLGKNSGEFIYVADCKLITTENLKQLGDTLFISVFPPP